MKKEKLAAHTKRGLSVILGLCITSSLFLSGCGSQNKTQNETQKKAQNETPKTPQQQADERRACVNNLKQIELALLNYESARKQFPPAYTTDASGKPLHSWRTLILPYMEGNNVYKKLKLNEPWNSPHNLAIFKNTPMEIYQCPADDQGDATRTNYVMIVGPKCVSDGPHSCGFKKLRPKGSSNTGHVIETTLPIKWYEPKDLKAEEISFKINDPNSPGIGSKHPGYVVYSLCDASVLLLREEVPPEKIRALFDITDTSFNTDQLPH